MTMAVREDAGTVAVASFAAAVSMAFEVRVAAAEDEEEQHPTQNPRLPQILPPQQTMLRSAAMRDMASGRRRTMQCCTTRCRTRMAAEQWQEQIPLQTPIPTPKNFQQCGGEQRGVERRVRQDATPDRRVRRRDRRQNRSQIVSRGGEWRGWPARWRGRVHCSRLFICNSSC